MVWRVDRDIWTKFDHRLNFIPYPPVSNHPKSTIPVFHLTFDFPVKNRSLRTLGGFFDRPREIRYAKRSQLIDFFPFFTIASTPFHPSRISGFRNSTIISIGFQVHRSLTNFGIYFAFFFSWRWNNPFLKFSWQILSILLFLILVIMPFYA